MSKQRLEGGDPAFADDEAEQYVREIRGQLRTAETLQEQGAHEGAARARARATSGVADLACRLERRFEHYARAAFGDRSDLIDDTVAEMFAELCRRLRDTSGTNTLMEKRFNLVVKCLIIDAVRKVRRHNDMTKDGVPDTNGYRVVSAEAAQERAAQTAAGERVANPLIVADPGAEDAFDRIVERTLGQMARDKLADLPPRQRRAVECRIFLGWEWAAVAAELGVSAKTAQTDLSQALSQLRAIFTEHGEKGVE